MIMQFKLYPVGERDMQRAIGIIEEGTRNRKHTRQQASRQLKMINK
jgi:hypothetical protein